MFQDGFKEKEYFKVLFWLKFTEYKFFPLTGVKPKKTFCDVCLRSDNFNFFSKLKWVCVDYACVDDATLNSTELCDMHFN